MHPTARSRDDNAILLTLASVLVPLGLLKLARGKAMANKRGMLWMNDFSSTAIAAIGIAEVVAGALMIAGSIKQIEAVARVGAVVALVVLSGAVYTHYRRKEHDAMVFPTILAAAGVAAVLLG